MCVEQGFSYVWVRVVGTFELHGERWKNKDTLPVVQYSPIAL